MTPYSIEPKDRIFVKDYGFLSFAKNMRKNIDKKRSINVSSKYSQKLLDLAKQSATHALNTTRRKVIKKTADATDDLICNKIANKITKHSPQSNLETDSKTEKKNMIIDDLRLI